MIIDINKEGVWECRCGIEIKRHEITIQIVGTGKTEWAAYHDWNANAQKKIDMSSGNPNVLILRGDSNG